MWFIVNFTTFKSFSSFLENSTIFLKIKRIKKRKSPFEFRANCNKTFFYLNFVEVPADALEPQADEDQQQNDGGYGGVTSRHNIAAAAVGSAADPVGRVYDEEGRSRWR